MEILTWAHNHKDPICFRCFRCRVFFLILGLGSVTGLEFMV